MEKINAMYRELLDSGETPDTAVMNYNTYRKLINDIGGKKTFISPPGIYLSNGTTLDLEIDDSLADDEIVILKR
jgi:hypothetical protein